MRRQRACPASGLHSEMVSVNLKWLSTTLRRTFTSWNDHDVPRLGAALAFYTMLSLAPLLILVVAIVGLVFGHKAAESQIASQVQGLVGEQGGEAIRAMIA